MSMESHRTYPAAQCTTCHANDVLVCVTHDHCEFNYHTARECQQESDRIQKTIIDTRQGLRWLEARGFSVA